MFKQKMYIAAKHEVYHYQDIPTKKWCVPSGYLLQFAMERSSIFKNAKLR